MSDKAAPLVPLLPGAAGRAAEEHTRFAKRAEEYPSAHGVQVKAVEFTAGASTKVAHKLGRVPQEYRVESASYGAPRFYESQDRDDKFLYFYSETDCIADLWVH